MSCAPRMLDDGLPIVVTASIPKRSTSSSATRTAAASSSTICLDSPKVLVTGRLEERPDGMVWSPHRVEGVVLVSVSEPEQLGELDRETAGR